FIELAQWLIAPSVGPMFIGQRGNEKELFEAFDDFDLQRCVGSAGGSCQRESLAETSSVGPRSKNSRATLSSGVGSTL
ncbi:MAG: hypothetical protein VX105_02500, partial [Cyanobacteriota bacterium]|nr:hypothetical protein [Cyanobacteriota bacterium]